MIITIGREFGSGGRELGKRLADALSIPCYDKEVINEVATLHNIAPDSVEQISRLDILQVYPMTIGGSLTPVYYNDNSIKVLLSQREVIRKLAEQGDCVFVGRAADEILSDMNTFNIFVYASQEAKLKRCMERSDGTETAKELLKNMKRIDKERRASRRIIADTEWGKKETYHLCINTSNIEVKSIVPALAEYVKLWFGQR